MSNMSYCMFENTLKDLRDCLDTLDEIEGDICLLSTSEMLAAEKLVNLCSEIHYYYNDWKK